MAPSRSALRTLNLLALAAIIAVSAFHLGRAGASRTSEERRRTAVVDAVKHAAPAVVSVAARSGGRRVWTEGAGAGVIVHPAGYVVTNSHVVKGARSIYVELFSNGGTFQCDKVLDRPRGDLALLKIRANRRFPYVSCCAGGKVMLGETAIAIGNPRGLGDTITVGVVSAVGRDAKMNNGIEMRDLIQTDASINTGNSGGALLNLDGELMGVIVSLLPSASGIAFAIPAPNVCALLQQALGGSPPANPLPNAPDRGPALAAKPTPQPRPAKPSASQSDGGPTLPKPRIGSGARATPKTTPKTTPMRASDFGITLQDTGRNLRVSQVASGSAAQKAGLKVGDLLLSIDGRPVESDLDILLSFSQARAGRTYQLQIRRGATQARIRLITPDS